MPQSLRNRGIPALFNEVRPVFFKLRQNAFLVMPAAYVVVLLLWYAYYGVLFSFSLGLVFLALLPLTLLLGRTAQFVKELTPFIVLLMSYEALQGVAGSLTLAPLFIRLVQVFLTESYRLFSPRSCRRTLQTPRASCTVCIFLS